MAILAECPRCHKVQSRKNKQCKCGLNLEKRKVKYHIVDRVNGKQKWWALTSFDDLDPYSLDDAKDVQAKFRTAKREGRLNVFQPKKESSMTFQELTDWYLQLEKIKSLASYETIEIYLRKFNKVFGNVVIGNIKLADLENHMEKRKKENLKPKTIDDEINYVKSMVIKAFDNDIVGGDILKVFKKVKKTLRKGSNARKQVYTPQQFQALIDNASTNHLRNILIIGYWTGMRKGEILKLTWDKIDLKNRMIRLEAEDTKEKKPKTIPIANEVYQILTKGEKIAGGVGHIITYCGKPVKGYRSSVRESHKKAGLKYGREVKDGFTVHDLRHTFVTDMRRAGVDRDVRASIVGHTINDMQDRYDTVDENDKLDAIRKLEAYRGKVRQNVSFGPLASK